jgi:hypothetical protein
MYCQVAPKAEREKQEHEGGKTQEGEEGENKKQEEKKKKKICSFSSNICTSKNQIGDSIFHSSRRCKN